MLNVFSEICRYIFTYSNTEYTIYKYINLY